MTNTAAQTTDPFGPAIVIVPCETTGTPEQPPTIITFAHVGPFVDTPAAWLWIEWYAATLPPNCFAVPLLNPTTAIETLRERGSL